MAAIRLDDDDSDNIENTLTFALVESTSGAVKDRSIVAVDSLASSTWEREVNKRNNNWLPPPWAIVALIVLGFNEFMTLLRNPFYLRVIIVAFLLVKALWVQLDVSGEFRHGALPGLISLSTKFLPTVMNIIKKLAEHGQVPVGNDPRRNPALPSRNIPNGVNSTSEMSSTGSSEITDNNHSSSSK